MYSDTTELVKKADQLFSLRAPVLRMWQVIAENFLPQRADFDNVSGVRLGHEPQDWLSDSYPILCCRDLSNSIDSMLRDGPWFEMTTGEGYEPDQAGKLWLADRTKRMRARMGERESGFNRAIKQGDQDYSAFGQTVIQVTLRRSLQGLLFRNWHLKDCAWFDDESGMVSGVVRRWHPTREELLATFGKDHPGIHDDIRKSYKKEPFGREEIYHIEFPTHLWRDGAYERFSHVSFFVDKKRCKIIEETPIPGLTYVIPRFLTLAESPYAYSPATMCALPDARTLQAMTFTLLETAERGVRPPYAVRKDAVIGEVDLSPDGITYLDNEYDERMGEAVRSLITDKGQYPIGQHERQRVVDTLYKAFYLDRINLPQKVAEQTAYEFAEMMKEYRRNNLPLFMPLEVEYNGQLVERAFDTLFRGRYLGPMHEIPDSLLGQEIKFKYKSPLSSAEEGTRMAKFGQIQQELTMAAQIDPTLAFVVDLPTAFRSAVQGIDVPPDWIASEEMFQQSVEMHQQQQMAQQALAAAEQMAAIVPPEAGAAA